MSATSKPRVLVFKDPEGKIVAKVGITAKQLATLRRMSRAANKSLKEFLFMCIWDLIESGAEQIDHIQRNAGAKGGAR